MQAAIKSPTNPNLPPGADTLNVTGLFNIPYQWSWSIGKTITNPDDTTYYTPLTVPQNDALTADEWASWTTQPNEYVLQICAKHQGLELA